MSNMGVAVVGTGFIGPVHIEALRRNGIDVVGVVEVNRELSEAAAKRLNLRKAFTDLDEALKDPEVHSVHITTPNKLHFSMAKKALEAGKHVVCEKPLAMTSAESAELVEIAAASKRAAAVNYNVRFYPINLHARELVRSGQLGKIFSVCGSYVQDWLIYPTDYNWRVLSEEGGELRAVSDIGTHWLDLVHFITGLEVEAVCADLKTFHETRLRPKGEVETFSGKGQPAPVEREEIPITTDDHGSVLIHFKGGARGTLWVSQVTAGRKNCLRYEIAAEKNALEWVSEKPNELWIGHRDAPNQQLLRDPSLLAEGARKHADFPGGHNEGFPDTFKQLYRAFYGYIAAGDFSAPAPFPTFADGHREIVLCDAILKSHRERRWVDVTE
ncbi:MAG: Gfo/Idh/MocA family oxidoreductase [Fimbriimonadaceae bacterium]